MNNIERPLGIIAGPCASESRAQMIDSATEAQRRGIEIVRLSLFKPRTAPGFEGIGDEGIPVLLEVAQMGLTPATEVLMPQDAEHVLNGVTGRDSNAKVMLWLGSRNQNNRIQKSIGEIIAGEDRVTLLIKNQMWKDRAHTKGIIEHVLSGGAKPEQLLMCHRGFQPSADGLRNPPDLDEALEIQDELAKTLGFVIPLIGDPSHSAGGSPENVMDMALRMANHRRIIDNVPRKIQGLMVEVHLNPLQAKTDKAQQLHWGQFDVLVEELQAREGI